MKKRAKPSYAGRVQWHPGMGRCPATKKRCFPNRSRARRAQRIQGSGSIYRCEHCGQFHTTSYTERVAKAIAYLLASIRDDQRKARMRRRNHKEANP